MVAWFYFVVLSVFAWGSSFYFIKIALREILPYNIVAWRISIGLIVISLIVAMARIKRPSGGWNIVHFIVLGVINTAIPFTCITWAEQEIASAVAGVINGSTPLITMLIASIVVSKERLTGPKLTGCLMGFTGLAVLLSVNVSMSGIVDNTKWTSTLVLIGAAVSYAIGAIYSRITMADIHPLWVAAASLASATVFMWAAVAISDEPLQIPVQTTTLFALFWMGAVGTALAYYLYFYLIQAWGAGKASMVAYVMPLSAIFMGVVFLSEVLSWRMLLGASMIIIGVYIAIQVKSFRMIRQA